MGICRILAAIKISVGGTDGGGGRELANGDVIGMAIAPVLAESDYHMRPYAPDVCRNRPDGHRCLHLIDASVGKAQYRDLANAQSRSRIAQLSLPHPGGFRQIDTSTFGPEASALSSRRGDEIGFHALSGVFGQSPANTKRFVVRMCQNG